MLTMTSNQSLFTRKWRDDAAEYKRRTQAIETRDSAFVYKLEKAEQDEQRAMRARGGKTTDTDKIILGVMSRANAQSAQQIADQLAEIDVRYVRERLRFLEAAGHVELAGGQSRHSHGVRTFIKAK